MKRHALVALLSVLIVALSISSSSVAFAAGPKKGGYVCHKGRTLHFEPYQHKAYQAHLDHGDKKGACRVYNGGDGGHGGHGGHGGIVGNGGNANGGKGGDGGKGGSGDQPGKPGKAGKPGKNY